MFTLIRYMKMILGYFLIYTRCECLEERKRERGEERKRSDSDVTAKILAALIGSLRRRGENDDDRRSASRRKKVVISLYSPSISFCSAVRSKKKLISYRKPDIDIFTYTSLQTFHFPSTYKSWLK